MSIYKHQAIIDADEDIIKSRRKELFDPETCPTCSGWGTIMRVDREDREQYFSCQDCGGEGIITSKRTK